MYLAFHCVLRFIKGSKRANDDYDDKSDHKHVKLCAILFRYVEILF